MQGERTKAKDSSLCEDCILKFDLSEAQRRIYIAYSGGVDSHVLLHCCASITQLKDKLTAVYVHHGLQAEADFWARHCEMRARDLGVEFLSLQVNAKAAPGESPEEAARNARYAALKSLLKANDALLLAQHREDQLETVLLQLFRGSGLRGLSGMPERITFGAGVMFRPFLNTPKQAISDYAAAHQLQWVEDPSNQSNDYDRNFLRNAIVPMLKQRWPAIDKTVARSARHCADAQVLVDEVADELFASVFDPVDKTLGIGRLLAHRSHLQQLIIRHWFRYLGLKMPSQARIERILSQVVAAAGDRDPVLSGQDCSIRRYRDKLYCLVDVSGTEPKASGGCVWPKGQTSIKITGDRVLSCVESAKGIERERWQTAKVEIRFRRGGEKIRLPGREGRHALKNLFQEAGIPPWERDVMPLVYLDDELAAVGDKWISAEFYSQKADGCIGLFLQT
ncbi:tRNA lysidine(34) synthetase TilS [Candidatus Methylobacter oryzae]|uniref:tRNA(Ile)-lysidine synthase n=1 Tax=Candidatus Methylobacter oryzae TaxID=2497749 RepID=A0ABY3CBB5_9GAMM|nr:tRNA lysidine(34) synthetase TilS [Candidatus Methylobacter oryzae]TRW96367.1 tRNA lysidine(34) synthetase TilS [Candidatus Methylobacter oryzae]